MATPAAASRHVQRVVTQAGLRSARPLRSQLALNRWVSSSSGARRSPASFGASSSAAIWLAAAAIGITAPLAYSLVSLN